jgi:hypothetical protein
MEAILRGEPCLNEAEFSSVVKHMNMKKTAPASILVMLIATRQHREWANQSDAHACFVTNG